MRGRDEHRKLRFGDITLTTDNCGKEYLVMKERDAKTRDGGDVNDNRDTKAKVMCVCDTRGKKCCPVEHFKTFAVHRPASRNHDTDPFYLGLKTGINYEEQPVWFTVAPMGVSQLGSLLPQACEMAGLQRKTNHGARKTCVKRLRRENVPPHKICQITGHKTAKA